MTDRWVFLAKVNYWEIGSTFPAMTLSQFSPDMHQAFIEYDHPTKYESISANHVCEIAQKC